MSDDVALVLAAQAGDPAGLGTLLERHRALLHAVAHIEFNAINLALDAVWRFAGLPEAYYRDWFRVAAEEASDDALRTLSYMRAFTESVHRGEIRGATNQRFDTVLNIGIGGSDLGPAMVARALWTPASPLRPHYLGNVDAHAWEEIRPRLDPRRTLVLVASKTFTTQETMTNAALVRGWLAEVMAARPDVVLVDLGWPSEATPVPADGALVRAHGASPVSAAAVAEVLAAGGMAPGGRG